MNKFVLSVIGEDRPGILAKISALLFSFGANIEDVSETILQGAFASIFIVSNLEARALEEIGRALNEALAPMSLSAHLRPMVERADKKEELGAQPFIITTRGTDKPGTIAAITGAMAELGCNVENYRAIITHERGVDEMIMIFETKVPVAVDHGALRQEVRLVCQRLGLESSVQHRDIFETLHRI